MKSEYEIQDLDEIVKTPNFVQDLISKVVGLCKNSNKVKH